MFGFCIKLNNATCVWGSKMQPIVSLSTCEAEYHAWKMSAKEKVWVRRVISDAGFPVQNPTSINSDKRSVID